ncbi:Nodule Cysteine-Rich (NCR) secreted peptide [Medicago truncatula]|uniref:Nodule Cysteine-Rich (NCR) secreted peptide n=1 Tax=Medicago truncatula TaxID=3880 RepID=A0A072UB12_MEDTR|nr:Nodule Cysteine-Rich (NCR) secreted peptide [Medicago truncatula]
MARILVFVFSFIVLLSQFLVVINGSIPCETTADCPVAVPPEYYKCMYKVCVLIR